MIKRIWTITGIVILGFASLCLLTNSLEEQAPLVTNEELHLPILKKVTEELHENYIGVDVKLTSKKELAIQVVGNEEYFISVKKDMESIVKSVIKTSSLKDCTIFFERWDLSTIITNENDSSNKELQHFLSNLAEDLKDYGIEYITSDDQLSSITIQTSIKGSNKKARKLALEIEKITFEFIQSKELDSTPHIAPYDIKILNTKGKVVN